MARWDYVRFWYVHGRGEVESTDSEMLKWIEETWIRSDPKAKIDVYTGIDGTPYGLEIRNKSRSFPEVYWVLIRQLCQSGWEPLGSWDFRRFSEEGEEAP